MNDLRRLLGCGPVWFCARVDQVHEEPLPSAKKQDDSVWLCCFEAQPPRVIRYETACDSKDDSVSLLEGPAELNNPVDDRVEVIIPPLQDEEISLCIEWETLRDSRAMTINGLVVERFDRNGSECSSKKHTSDHDGSSYSSLFQNRPTFLEPRNMKRRLGLLALVQHSQSRRDAQDTTVSTMECTRLSI
jgi:hypothetical protein